MALNILSKKFHDNMQKFIIDNFVQPSELGYSEYPNPIDINDFKEVATTILDIFRMEKFRNYNRLHVGVETEMRTFVDWCQGLPSVLNTDWYLKPCVDTYMDLLEIDDKQRKRYKSLYTEEFCEKMISEHVFNELYRSTKSKF